MSDASANSGARRVALGILASRVLGLGRGVVLAHLFGSGALTDAWNTAMRIPNALQNLLGEQAISAAFIPVYSKFLEAGREDDARRLAGAILGLMLAAVGTLVLAGVLLARWIVALTVTGFLDDSAQVGAGQAGIDRFELVVTATRFIFPMAGCLVLAAWALGVLNSHRRFFLPYVAPTLWSAAILTALIGAAARDGHLLDPQLAPLAELEGWMMAGLAGAALGGLLQLLVQLPTVLRLSPGLRPSLALAAPGVRRVLAAFGPALAGRGVVQLSLYLNIWMASFLSRGSVAALGFAAPLYSLPLSVFGMSVAAAELPELARGGEQAAGQLARRIDQAVRRSLFLIVPAAVGLATFGLLAVGLLYERGQFGVDDRWQVYAVLCGYLFGLPASAVSRLLQNTFFALGDTRTPARVALGRLFFVAPVGAGLMLWLDGFDVGGAFGLGQTEALAPLTLGALGLSCADGLAAWIELGWLRRRLAQRLPEVGLPVRYFVERLFLALLLTLPCLALWAVLPAWPVAVIALIVLPTYAASYLGLARLRHSPELAGWLRRG